MTAEKHPLETVREALEKGIELLEPFEESGLLGNQALNKHRASLDILTTYMSQPQSCAECERLGRENARLREAVRDLAGGIAESDCFNLDKLLQKHAETMIRMRCGYCCQNGLVYHVNNEISYDAECNICGGKSRGTKS